MYCEHCSDLEVKTLAEMAINKDNDVYLRFDPFSKEINLDLDTCYSLSWFIKREKINIKYCPFCGKTL